ncbi:ribosomal protein [Hirsutella rhossiliensis]|uniref:Ribosomal protein s11 domain-containing protein n=1 Tax=Hirsutella rhossiliensis TaxID=111463 RepID=A0A9P8N7W5_9HYPO|nr:ribosomal protein s11 domain-containing protein [Hirsutella rhossiliensis]KAH0968379.1 ribosomal protein s11 domain-containing protein [Hirsutella rhossiliensis]
MSRPLTRCLAALPSLGAPRVAALGRPLQTTTTTTTTTRLLSTTRPRRQDETSPEPPLRTPPAEKPLRDFFGGSLATGQAAQPQNPTDDISQRLVMKALGKTATIDTSPLSGDPAKLTMPRAAADLEPHHLHVFSHRHNTHITFTRPNREPIMSLSCGNLGYRKSRRGTFDSAYSLTKYVLERLVYTGVRFDRLELVMRGFGPGREAAIKVLMSPEGKFFRDKIIRVADSTRVKFAGTRSEKPRRL